MKRILSLVLTLIVAALMAPGQTPKPSVLVIFGDDIGITNISAYGRGQAMAMSSSTCLLRTEALFTLAFSGNKQST